MRLQLSPVTLGLAAIGLAAAEWGGRLAGYSLAAAGPLDETAHLLTSLLVVWALGRAACERYLVPALVSSVAIDADHIPDRLGVEWLTEGTKRPYTHSLLTIAVMLVVALFWRRRRRLLVGISLGLTIHFWRDLAQPDSGVPLLWPISSHSFGIPYASYVAAMIAVVAIDARRLRSRRELAATHN
jgi:membrane-bound metal-dependent hydrolase YbcI (DUF457 family)